VDIVAVGGQPRRHRRPLGPGAVGDQRARDDEMLGEPVRLVVADQGAARSLVENGAGDELHRQRQQQDGEQPPEQANRDPQRRMTPALSM
jgi:hypothetical protein